MNGLPGGRADAVMQELVGTMERASSELAFERAALIRDQIAAVKRVQANNAALIAVGEHFEQRQRQVYQNAVGQLRQELGLPDPPAVEEDVDRADHPAGAVHAAENP